MRDTRRRRLVESVFPARWCISRKNFGGRQRRGGLYTTSRYLVLQPVFFLVFSSPGFINYIPHPYNIFTYLSLLLTSIALYWCLRYCIFILVCLDIPNTTVYVSFMLYHLLFCHAIQSEGSEVCPCWLYEIYPTHITPQTSRFHHKCFFKCDFQYSFPIGPFPYLLFI